MQKPRLGAARRQAQETTTDPSKVRSGTIRMGSSLPLSPDRFEDEPTTIMWKISSVGSMQLPAGAPVAHTGEKDAAIRECLELRALAGRLRSTSHCLEGEAREAILNEALKHEMEAVCKDPEFGTLVSSLSREDPLEFAHGLETEVDKKYSEISALEQKKSEVILSGAGSGTVLSVFDRICARIDRLKVEAELLQRLETDLEEKILLKAVPDLEIPQDNTVAREMFRWIANGLVTLTIDVDLRVYALLSVESVDAVIDRVIKSTDDRSRARDICKKILSKEMERIRSDPTISSDEYTTEMTNLASALKHLVSWATLRNKKRSGPWEHERIIKLGQAGIMKRFGYLDILAEHGDAISLYELSKRGMASADCIADLKEFPEDCFNTLLCDDLLSALKENGKMPQGSQTVDAILLRETHAGTCMRSVIEAIPEAILHEDMRASDKDVLLSMTFNSDSRHRALAIVNSVLNKRGIALIEKNGSVILCKVTHTISYRWFSSMRGIVVKGLEGEKPTGSAAAFFQSGSNLIVIKTPSVLKNLTEGPASISYTYRHEFEHLIQSVTGLTRSLVKLAVDRYRNEEERTDFISGRMEGAAIAMEMLAELNSESELSVLKALLKACEVHGNAIFNDQAHSAGYSLLRGAFLPAIRADTRLELAVSRLNNIVDGIYREALGLSRYKLFPEICELVALETFLGGDEPWRTSTKRITDMYPGISPEKYLLDRLSKAQEGWQSE